MSNQMKCRSPIGLSFHKNTTLLIRVVLKRTETEVQSLINILVQNPFLLVFCHRKIKIINVLFNISAVVSKLIVQRFINVALRNLHFRFRLVDGIDTENMRIAGVLLIFVISVVTADDHGSDAVSHTSETFSSQVEEMKHFVMFFAPW